MGEPGNATQPWTTPKGNILVYNGEIFNYYELKQKYKDQKEAASVTLYARYLKRVGGHLKNITTTMLNPYEEIGYRPSK